MFKLIKFITVVCFTTSLVLVSPAILADPPEGHSNGHSKGHGNGKQKSKVKNFKFSEQDRLNILNYFNANPFPVTALPPGIAKNLARGKPLPPGIAKKYLPKDVLSLLPNYPGYEYLAAGNNVLLVNATTKIIADILPNLISGN